MLSTRSRLLILMLVAAVLSSAFIGSAPADERSVSDPDDSLSPLDVERVVQGHYFEYVLYRVVSFEPWVPQDLAGGSMVFSFNTDGDEAVERRGILEYVGGGGSQMRLTVVNAAGEQVGRGVHRRSSRRSVEVWFKRRVLGYPKTYRMSVEVTTSASPDCSEGCSDLVPDDGAMFHRLRRLCNGEEPTIVGSGGDDTIRGTSKRDVIDAKAGDDEITHVGGRDVVCGRRGDDTIRGGRGYLTLRGGKGSDRISATGPQPRPCDDTGGGSAACAFPEAHLIGGPGNDVIAGGEYHEHLIGGGGRDLLEGRRFGDRLDGGAGYDVLRGGRGTDGCRRGEELYSCES